MTDMHRAPGLQFPKGTQRKADDRETQASRLRRTRPPREPSGAIAR